MEVGQARLFFGNIELTNGWDGTFQDGVQPSAFLIRSPPHLSSLDLFADLVIEQDGRRRTFINCHIADPVFDAGLDGQEWTLPILDRRWMWAGTTISGSYNVRQADETLLREKMPWEIATLLLNYLGEFNIDVSALVNDARPHITWEEASARDELDRLCNDFGCIVCIEQDGNRKVTIAKIGVGPALPPGPALGGEYSIAAKPLPSAVEVITDRTIYEAEFVLEEIGMETDLSYKAPVDLSYIPHLGWGSQWPGITPDVTGTYVDRFDGQTKDNRDLAIAYIFRAHRVVGIEAAGNWQPWGTGAQPIPEWCVPWLEPEKFKDLLLLSNRAAEIVIAIDPARSDFEIEPLPPMLTGTWHDWFKGDQVDKIWPWGFSLDTKHGIVITSQPAFKYNPLTPEVPFTFAALKLRTAFYAGKDGVFNNFRISRSVPGSLPNAPLAPFFRKELRRRIIAARPVEIDNIGPLVSELIAYATDLVANLTPTDSTTVEYEMIRDDIELSGKVRQITYAGGGGRSGTTKVSTGTPHNPYVETSDTQRLPRELRDAVRGVVRLGAVDYTLPSTKWWQS